MCLLFLESLELFDKVQLKLWAEPRTKLEGDVAVRIGAAVSPSFGV
jgi:hypothetical protein